MTPPNSGLLRHVKNNWLLCLPLYHKLHRGQLVLESKVDTPGVVEYQIIH